MKVTKVLTVNIDNTPVTDQGKQVYRALVSTGARNTQELCRHVNLSEGVVDLMLTQLYRHDLVELRI